MSKDNIQEVVKKSLEKYFRDLGEQEPSNVYEMVIFTVEKPILEAVMERAEGNQSHAGHQPKHTAQKTAAARPALILSGQQAKHGHREATLLRLFTFYPGNPDDQTSADLRIRQDRRA